MKKVVLSLVATGMSFAALAASCVVSGFGWTVTVTCSCDYIQACSYASQVLHALV